MANQKPTGGSAAIHRGNGSEVRVSIEHRSSGPLLAIRHFCLGFDGVTSYQRGSIIIFPGELAGMIVAMQGAASKMCTAASTTPIHTRQDLVPGLQEDYR